MYTVTRTDHSNNTVRKYNFESEEEAQDFMIDDALDNNRSGKYRYAIDCEGEEKMA